MDPKKETFLDEFGRKARTVHLDGNGQLDYENVYSYADNKDPLPVSCEQTYFREDGTRERKDNAFFDRASHSFITTKKSFYDNLNRKTESCHFDDLGRLDYVNKYMYDSADDKRPNTVEQTYFRPDGTKEKSEILFFNEKINNHQTQKETLFDEFGRKSVTNHFNENGVLEYRNEYSFITGNAKTPSYLTQTHFRENGNKEQKTIYNYNQRTNSFDRVHTSVYDREGKPVLTTDYDENGKKISEKTYAKQNGQDIIYRKKFKDGIVMQEGAYVRLAGQLVEWTPDVSKILAEYDRRFTNTNNNQEKETQKSNENKTTDNRVFAAIKQIVTR